MTTQREPDPCLERRIRSSMFTKMVPLQKFCSTGSDMLKHYESLITIDKKWQQAPCLFTADKNLPILLF